MTPPELVVEVVSPGELQRDRDYIAKHAQYQARGIPEYWLIDPELRAVIVLWLNAEVYVEVGTFRNGDRIASPTFCELQLTAEQVFAGET